MKTDIYGAAEEAFGSYPNQISIHNLGPVHKKILLICQDCPDAVNDRSRLLAEFYGKDWDYNQSLYANFSRLTRPETVVRRFRDLREWGYVKQSEKVDKANYDAMKSERERHSPIPPQVKRVYYDEVQEVSAEIYKQTRLV